MYDYHECVLVCVEFDRDDNVYVDPDEVCRLVTSRLKEASRWQADNQSMRHAPEIM